MATITTFAAATLAALPAGSIKKQGVIPVTLDTLLGKAPGNVPAADVVEAIKIAAGTFVEFTALRVVTPEGGTLTVDVGDGVTPAGYQSNVNMNAAAGTLVKSSLALTEGTPNTITGYSGGKFYTADDTIDVVFDNAADLAKFVLYACVVVLEG